VQYPLPEALDLYPYKRNQNKSFQDVHQYIHHAKNWKKQCDAGMMLYEYHFYLHQYYDLSQMTFAHNLYTDIKNYKKHGFQGLINDCSQRSYFPNGFPFFLYGQLQFDTSLSFEALREDYFSHAYGEDWREVLAYLQRLGEAVDPLFVQGKRSADLRVAKRYNPAEAAKMRRVREINAEFAPFTEAHRVMPYRAQTVAYKLLRYYLEYTEGITDALILKAHGAGAEAQRVFDAFLARFGNHECEIELWFDQAMCGRAWQFGVFSKPEATLPGAEAPHAPLAADGDITQANE
jgi:hypothetical protein